MKKKIDGRGGARAGAGRKPTGVTKVTVSYDVLPETQDAIKVLAKDKKSYGAVVDKAVKYLLEKE